MNIKILTLNNSKFISLIEQKLNQPIIKFESGQFADSECFVKPLKDLSLNNQNILIIHQFSFDKKSINDQVIELLYFADLIKQMGAAKIDLVMPYYPYSRQDKSFDGKHRGFLFLIDHLLKSSNINKVFCFELHKSDSTKVFITKTEEISLVQFGADFFKENKKNFFVGDNICFLSPDEGRAESIKKIADLVGVSFGYVKKKRISNDVSVSLEIVGDVENKNIIIIDDIIDTGNTAIGACQLVLKNGAKTVVGFFGHPVLSKGCVYKLEKSGFQKIFVTDTVDIGDKIEDSKKIKQITLVNVLVEYLKNKYF